MTSGQRQGPALEIVQTRDIAFAEWRDMTRLWEKLVGRRGSSWLYTAVFYLWYAFAAFLTVSILMTVRALNEVEPDLALQLVVAALGLPSSSSAHTGSAGARYGAATGSRCRPVTAMRWWRTACTGARRAASIHALWTRSRP
jgi:hypothetical protein